jgi:hypothetical protein
MDDLTRVYAFKGIDEAAKAAGHWKGHGFNVVVAGPTDAIRLSNEDTGTAFWESGESADWYLVVASKASMEIIASKSQ